MFCGPPPPKAKKPKTIEVTCLFCKLTSGVSDKAKTCPGCGAYLPSGEPDTMLVPMSNH